MKKYIIGDEDDFPEGTGYHAYDVSGISAAQDQRSDRAFGRGPVSAIKSRLIEQIQKFNEPHLSKDEVIKIICETNLSLNNIGTDKWGKENK